jgi:cytochrome b subunit of formate dehydrogenase
MYLKVDINVSSLQSTCSFKINLSFLNLGLSSICLCFGSDFPFVWNYFPHFQTSYLLHVIEVTIIKINWVMPLYLGINQ